MTALKSLNDDKESGNTQEEEWLGTDLFLHLIFKSLLPTVCLPRQWFINIHIINKVCNYTGNLRDFSFKFYQASTGLTMCGWDRVNCVILRSSLHENKICSRSMLHFHTKWSISSKSVSLGFQNMIIHTTTQQLCLYEDDVRQAITAVTMKGRGHFTEEMKDSPWRKSCSL